MYDTSVPVEPQTAFVLDSQSSDGLIVLATTAAEAPNRLPADLNLDRLQ
jgi:hypothetical protein